MISSSLRPPTSFFDGEVRPICSIAGIFCSPALVARNTLLPFCVHSLMPPVSYRISSFMMSCIVHLPSLIDTQLPSVTQESETRPRAVMRSRAISVSQEMKEGTASVGRIEDQWRIDANSVAHRVALRGERRWMQTAYGYSDAAELRRPRWRAGHACPPARLNGRRTEKPSRRQRPSALRRSVGEETKSERGPFVCLSVCRSVPASARSAMPSSARVRVGAGRGFETEGEQRGREEGSILKRAFFALALSQDIRGGGCGRHSRRASPSGRAEKGRMQRKGISAWHLSFVFVVSD